MNEIKIGAGGWAYFNVPGDRLFHYSRIFDMVEVNSTFYTYPDMGLVESWRQRTPSDFEFTVRCHRDLTHRYRLRPIKQSVQVFDRMVRICKALKAEILHIQTPPSFKLLSDQVKTIRALLSTINVKTVRIAWEIRWERSRPLSEEILKLFEDYNIIHCIDISKGEAPAKTGDILYTRLFGLGKHNIYQYSDRELKGINDWAEGSNTQKVILNFHTIQGYRDAARLKVFRQTGRFPAVTTTLGIESLLRVLEEDVEFPTTKHELIQDQGWKLFDMKEDLRLQVSEILKLLPDRIYHNLQDLRRVLRTRVSRSGKVCGADR